MLLLSSLVPGIADGATLVIQHASTAALWADHGSGSAHDATVFRTIVPSGYSAVSDYAQVGYGDAGTFTQWRTPYGPPIAVAQQGDGLLAKPARWNKIYEASTTAPFSLWRAEPPAGFVAVGDVGARVGRSG